MNNLWETPQPFFDALDREFHFTLDVAALPDNAKCERFLTWNSLMCDWSKDVCWMNPPYEDPLPWVRKAYETAQDGGTVVCLLRASTDTQWFHDYCLKASEIRFVKNRIDFMVNGRRHGRGNHPSIVCVFRPGCSGPPVVSSISNGGQV